jgi:hypothetical protein
MYLWFSDPTSNQWVLSNNFSGTGIGLVTMVEQLTARVAALEAKGATA